MARGFNLTAQIALAGPTNVGPVVASIKKQLNGITANVQVKLSKGADTQIDSLNKKLGGLNRTLIATASNANNLGNALSKLNGAFRAFSSASSGNVKNVKDLGAALKGIKAEASDAGNQLQQFGKDAGLAFRRFAAFSVSTAAIVGFFAALRSGISDAVKFDSQMVKLSQVTQTSVKGLSGLSNEITRLATTFGVTSESLVEVSSTLAQAGLTARDTKIALEALAKSALAPSFDNITETTEGAIAAMRQFTIGAGQLEGALGSINAVAAAFAVESADIITAIRTTGGVFAAASKGVSEGTDALNEFISVFTSVRQTTRESAESIATGLRTIFTRIQRGSTIDSLKDFGITLTDLEGKFVGPYEAVRRLSEGLKTLDPRDLRFSQIVEELGGFRQIGKVIPLIQQFGVAQKALGIAQRGSNSLTQDAAAAQQALLVQITKVKEQFLGLMRSFAQSTTFNAFVNLTLKLAEGLVQVGTAMKPIVPFLALLATAKIASGITQFASGFFGGIKKGGGAGAVGGNLAAAATGTNTAASAAKTANMSANTTALTALTAAISKLGSQISSGILFRRKSEGGYAFNSGGLVPGVGNGDTVPASLTPGEFVIRKAAVQSLGVDTLAGLNKGGYAPRKRYAGGGLVNTQNVGAAILGNKEELGKVQGVQTFIKFDKQSPTKVDQEGIAANLIPNGKSYTIVKQALSRDRYLEFNKAINAGLLAGVNKASLSLGGPSIEESSGANFLKGINDAARGNIFEDVLSVIRKKGVFDKDTSPQRPFDFTNGLGASISAKNFPALNNMNYVDAKASFNAASNESLISKIKNQLVREAQGQKGATTLNKEDTDTIDIPSINKNADKLLTPHQIKQALGLHRDVKLLELSEDEYIQKDAEARKVIEAKRSNKLVARHALGGAIKKRAAVFDFDDTLAETDAALTGSFSQFRDPAHVLSARPTKYTDQARKAKEKGYAVYVLTARHSVTNDAIKSFAAKNGVELDEVFSMADSYQDHKVPGKVPGTTRIPSTAQKKALKLAELSAQHSRVAFFDDDETNINTARASRLHNLKTVRARKADGGATTGTDTVPALLTPGEFVINKQAADRLGASKLHALNNADRVQRYATGGFVRMATGGGPLKARPATQDLLNDAYQFTGGTVDFKPFMLELKKSGIGQTQYNRALTIAAQAILAGSNSTEAFDKAQQYAAKSTTKIAQRMELKASKTLGGKLFGVNKEERQQRFQQAAFGAIFAGGLIQEGIGNKSAGAAATGGFVGGLTSGAGTGFQLGGVFGPKGAAAGAIVGGTLGAVNGAVNGASEFAATKAAKDLEDAFTRLDKAAKDTTKDGLSGFNVALQEATNALEASSQVAFDRFSTSFNPLLSLTSRGTRRAADELGSGGLLKDEILSFLGDYVPPSIVDGKAAEKRIKDATDISINKEAKDVASNANQLLPVIDNQLSKALKRNRNIDTIATKNPNLVAQFAATDTDTNAAIIRLKEQQQETSDPVKIKKLEEQIDKVRLDTFKRLAKAKQTEIDLENKLVDATKLATKNFQKFLDTFSTASAITERASALRANQTQAIEQQFSNLTPGGSTSIGDIADESNVFSNSRAYSEAEIQKQFEKLSSNFNTSNSSFSNNIAGVKQLESILPDIFLEAAKINQLEGQTDEDVRDARVTHVNKKLEEAQVPEQLRAILSAKFKDDVTRKGSIDFDETSSLSYLKELEGAVFTAAVNLQKGLQDANQTYINGVNKYIQATIDINNHKLDIEEKSADFSIANATRFGKELSVAELSAPATNRVNSLAGTNDINAIVAKRTALEKRNETLNQDKTKNAVELSKNNIELEKLKNALGILANDTRKLAAIEQKLANVNSKREAGRNLIQGFFGADPLEKRQQVNELAAFNLARNGQLNAFNPQMVNDAFAGYDKIKEFLKPEDREQALANIFKNFPDIGFPPDLKQLMITAAGQAPIEQQLLQQLTEAQTQQINAANALEPSIQKLEEVLQTLAKNLAAETELLAKAFNIAGNVETIAPPSPRDMSGGRNGAQQFARGGHVRYRQEGSAGPEFIPSGTDTVPAMLTPGEFVVNAKATAKHQALLEKINGNRTAYASKGGMISYLAGGGPIRRRDGSIVEGYTGPTIEEGPLPQYSTGVTASTSLEDILGSQAEQYARAESLAATKADVQRRNSFVAESTDYRKIAAYNQIKNKAGKAVADEFYETQSSYTDTSDQVREVQRTVGQQSENIVLAAGKGARAGAKALVNEGTKAAVGTVTLGQYEAGNVLGVSKEDQKYAYDDAVIAARIATEAGLAAATGGLSQLGNTGKLGKLGLAVGNGLATLDKATALATGVSGVVDTLQAAKEGEISYGGIAKTVLGVAGSRKGGFGNGDNPLPTFGKVNKVLSETNPNVPLFNPQGKVAKGLDALIGSPQAAGKLGLSGAKGLANLGIAGTKGLANLGVGSVKGLGGILGLGKTTNPFAGIAGTMGSRAGGAGFLQKRLPTFLNAGRGIVGAGRSATRGLLDTFSQSTKKADGVADLVSEQRAIAVQKQLMNRTFNANDAGQVIAGGSDFTKKQLAGLGGYFQKNPSVRGAFYPASKGRGKAIGIRAGIADADKTLDHELVHAGAFSGKARRELAIIKKQQRKAFNAGNREEWMHWKFEEEGLASKYGADSYSGAGQRAYYYNNYNNRLKKPRGKGRVAPIPYASGGIVDSLPKYAMGGWINGKKGDKNLILAGDGEYVVNENAAAKNAGALEYMNKGGKVEYFKKKKDIEEAGGIANYVAQQSKANRIKNRASKIELDENFNALPPKYTAADALRDGAKRREARENKANFGVKPDLAINGQPTFSKDARDRINTARSQNATNALQGVGRVASNTFGAATGAIRAGVNAVTQNPIVQQGVQAAQRGIQQYKPATSSSTSSSVTPGSNLFDSAATGALTSFASAVEKLAGLGSLKVEVSIGSVAPQTINITGLDSFEVKIKEDIMKQVVEQIKMNVNGLTGETKDRSDGGPSPSSIPRNV